MGAWLHRACVFKIKPLVYINTTKSKNKTLLNQIHNLISRNAKVLTQIQEDKENPNTLSGQLRQEPRSLNPANPLLSKRLCPASLCTHRTPLVSSGQICAQLSLQVY